MASSCASDAPSHSSARDTSPELCTASTSTNNDDRCTSVTSSAGGIRKFFCYFYQTFTLPCNFLLKNVLNASFFTGSVEIIDKDGSGNNGGGNKVDGESAKSSAVDGFSFFYDPNEPTSICDAPSLTAEGNEASCEFCMSSTLCSNRLFFVPTYGNCKTFLNYHLIFQSLRNSLVVTKIRFYIVIVFCYSENKLIT